jgi:hypothetical protein
MARKTLNPLQRTLFVSDSEFSAIIGQRLELRRSADVDCPKCQGRIGMIGEGTAMHAVSVNCSYCGRFRGWLPHKTAKSILETVKTFGRIPVMTLRDISNEFAEPSGASSASIPAPTETAHGGTSTMSNEDDFNDIYGKKYFSCDDLHGETQQYKIGKSQIVEVREKDGTVKKKIAVFFKGEDTSLLLNMTNANTLANAFSKDRAQWIGHTVEAFSEMTSLGKPGVRLRELKPKRPDPVSTGKVSIIPDPDLDDDIPPDMS